MFATIDDPMDADDGTNKRARSELEEAAVRVMLGSLDAVEREAETFWEDLPSLTRETLRALRVSNGRRAHGACFGVPNAPGGNYRVKPYVAGL